MILISNDRTSASKKIKGMASIRTLTVSNTALERTKEKFYGFRQTVVLQDAIFLTTCLATLKKKSTASCRRYDIHVAMSAFKKSLQSLQKVEASSAAIATRCKVSLQLVSQWHSKTSCRNTAACNMPSQQLVSQHFSV